MYTTMPLVLASPSTATTPGCSRPSGSSTSLNERYQEIFGDETPTFKQLLMAMFDTSGENDDVVFCENRKFSASFD